MTAFCPWQDVWMSLASSWVCSNFTPFRSQPGQLRGRALWTKQKYEQVFVIMGSWQINSWFLSSPRLLFFFTPPGFKPCRRVTWCMPQWYEQSMLQRIELISIGTNIIHLLSYYCTTESSKWQQWKQKAGYSIDFQPIKGDHMCVCGYMYRRAHTHKQKTFLWLPKIVFRFEPAARWDEKLVVVLPGSIIHLYRLVDCVHQNHLRCNVFFLNVCGHNLQDKVSFVFLTSFSVHTSIPYCW